MARRRTMDGDEYEATSKVSIYKNPYPSAGFPHQAQEEGQEERRDLQDLHLVGCLDREASPRITAIVIFGSLGFSTASYHCVGRRRVTPGDSH